MVHGPCAHLWSWGHGHKSTSIKQEITFWPLGPLAWPNGESEKVVIQSLWGGHPEVHSYQAWDLWIKWLQNMPYLLNGGATGTFWPLWPWKLREKINEDNMWCSLDRCTYHIFFQFFGPVSSEKSHIFTFDVWPPIGQMVNQKMSLVSLWLGVIQGYIPTKFEISG